jgi:hypothetical protein
MKNYRIGCVVLALFSFYFSGFALDVESNSEKNEFLDINRIVDNKYYIEPGTIYVSQSQIFLNVSGCLVPINSLFCDEAGIYALVDELLESRAGNDSWICDHCGTKNNGGSFCSLCMKRRKEAK